MVTKQRNLHSHDDVVDWNVYQLHEEADESHDGESDGCSHGDFLKL